MKPFQQILGKTLYTCRRLLSFLLRLFQLYKYDIYFVSQTQLFSYWLWRGSRGHDPMVVGFITTNAISAYHHKRYELESRSRRGVLDATSCDKVCPWLAAAGLWFSPESLISSNNKTDRHDKAKILLKEEFEDTKRATRIRILKKNRQHNGQKKKYKRTNNDLQNVHIKLKIE
jgi:hypothetical protein